MTLPTNLPHDHTAPTVFNPAHLLREARRQRNLPGHPVPALCVLDPDGDLARHLRTQGARPNPAWACYHTELLDFTLPGGTRIGVLPNAVGAPFAVLVAEQLFASGAKSLLSITSSGQVADLGPPPYVVLIDSARRDEGTSTHYLPTDAPAFAPNPSPALLARMAHALAQAFPPEHPVTVHQGPTWTTDAPYRETQAAIDAARAQGVLAVEMEAAALYAFATHHHVPVLCVAHVTNAMGQHGDFEKGEAGGAHTALRIIEAAAAAFQTA